MKTTSILLALTMILGAFALPVAADADHNETDRDDRDGRDASDRRAAMQEKRDAAKDRADERRNESKDDRKMDSRGPAAHATQKFVEKCRAYENTTGETHRKCQVARHVAEPCIKDRRAAHAGLKAIDHLEHRIVKLERHEIRALKALESENLTTNQTAHLEAKLDRIQAAQNKTIDKIDAIQDRMDLLEGRCDKVKDHIKDRVKFAVCHVGDDNETHTLRIAASAWPSHEAHNDTKGACPGDAFEPEREEHPDDEAPEAAPEDEA